MTFVVPLAVDGNVPRCEIFIIIHFNLLFIKGCRSLPIAKEFSSNTCDSSIKGETDSDEELCNEQDVHVAYLQNIYTKYADLDRRDLIKTCNKRKLNCALIYITRASLLKTINQIRETSL